jgi:hypothetical protein
MLFNTLVYFLYIMKNIYNIYKKILLFKSSIFTPLDI